MNPVLSPISSSLFGHFPFENLVKKTVITLFFTLVIFSVSSAQERYFERNLLTTNYSKTDVTNTLATGTEWVPYPAYSDRAEWESLPEHQRLQYIAEGEPYLDHVWISIPATSYLEYERSGNRQLQSDYLRDITTPLRTLFMAELMEGEGRFIDQIINGVWALCESSFWGSVAHLGRDGLPDVLNPHIDLGSTNISQLLSWIHYFMEEEFDAINPGIAKRIRYEVHHRLLKPYYERTDFWWMGFEGSRVHRLNNHNPHNNSNILTIILLMEHDRQKRIDGVFKLMSSLENFINCYPEDGGCDEGPSYWRMAGGANFETLHLLRMATGGFIDIFDDPLIQNMGKYIYRVNISYPYFYNYSDGSAKPNPSSYVVYKYGEQINDPVMMAFGAFLAGKQNFGQSGFSGSPFMVFESLFDQQAILNYPPDEPLPGDFWLPGLQIMGARDNEGSSDGFFFAAKAGHNAGWNHNHNDVGSFILYYDGTPLLIDAGVQSYTAQTFGPGRYDLWTMQSSYHNLPVINGHIQSTGREFEATDVSYHPTADQVAFFMDIAGVYPKEAGIEQWVRSYTFNRGKNLIIHDTYRLHEVKEPFYQTFLSWPEPVLTKPGSIEWTMPSGKKLAMHYPDDKYSADIEVMKLTDNRLQSSWGDRIYRILLTSKYNAADGYSEIVISD